MAAGTPSAKIGAQFPLGFVTQSTLGTPVVVPASAGNWINQTANTLKYSTGTHMIKTALGNRATEQESAFGETHLDGGFEANLRTSTCRTLIEALLGSNSTSAGTVTCSVSTPTLLTIEDNWAGESHQYADCMLSEATVSCGNHLEWKIAFTVFGGTEALITSGTPTFSASDKTLAWADVTGLTGFSALAGQISQFSFKINNGVKQDYGAGQHAPTSVIGGEFTVSGDATIRYDTAAAATVAADFTAGTDLGPSTLSIGTSGGTTATGTATIASGAVSAVTVTNGGTGYNNAGTVTFSGGGGSGATGTIVQSGGVISSVTVTSGGSGYTSAPTVTFSAPVGNQHQIYFPSITLLTAELQKPLDDFMRLKITFGCKSAQLMTWSLPSA